MDTTRFETLVREALEKPDHLRETFVLEATDDDELRTAVTVALGKIADQRSAADETRFETLVREALQHPEHLRTTFIADETSGDPKLRDAVQAAVSRVHGHLDQIDLKPGQTVGPYLLKEPLGQGGMGAVYLAWQSEPVERHVALKCIKPGVDSRELLTRFEAERRALALMSHPNVATVYDAGVTEQGRPYFAMEYVPGVEITDYCDRHALNLRQRAELFIQACDGVEHAHQKGVIHRDLKPSNILVTEKSDRPLVKIIDFGIAKSLIGDDQGTILTQVGGFIGTPLYASPEQSEYSADIDTRTDVYSLGMVLYELIVGRLPFNPRILREKKVRDVQAFLREADPPTPSARFSSLTRDQELIATKRAQTPAAFARELRSDLGWIAMHAIEKAPDDRYPSADAMIADLRRYLANAPVEARAHTPLYRAQKFVRRHRIAVAFSAAIALATLGVAVSSTWLWLEAQTQRDIAEQQAARAEKAVDVFFDMLRSIEPADLVDGRMDANALIQDGAARIQANFTDAPDRQAEFLIDLARAWTNIDPWMASELLSKAREAADRLQGSEQNRLRSAELGVRANIVDIVGSTAKAVELARAGFVEAEKSGDPEARYDAMIELANLLTSGGEFREALKIQDQLIELLDARRLDFDAETYLNERGHVWLEKARNHLILDDLERTRAALERAEEIFSVTADDYGTRTAMIRRAELDHAQGNYHDALVTTEQELDDARASGDPLWTNETLDRIGSVNLDYGDLRRAEAALQESIMLASGVDVEVVTAGLLGLTLLERGELEDARAFLARSVAAGIAMEGELSDLTALARLGMAALHARIGDVSSTRSEVSQAAPILSRVYGDDSRYLLIGGGIEAAARLRSGDHNAVPDLERHLMVLHERGEKGFWIRYLAQALADESPQPKAQWIAMARSAFEAENPGPKGDLSTEN